MSVADLAAQRIRQLVASGELAPGQRLPSEPKLAAELGLSRSSLREAIRSLAQARVLEVRRGDGTYVSSLAPDHLLGDLGFGLDLMRDGTLPEAAEVRRLLEPAATGLAAGRATDDQFAELAANVAAMRATTDESELVALDCAFHAAVMACTGNAMLCRLVDAVAGRAVRARIWRGLPECGAEVVTQHAQILHALERRDAGLAAAASALHVAASEEWLRTAIDREPGVSGL